MHRAAGRLSVCRFVSLRSVGDPLVPSAANSGFLRVPLFTRAQVDGARLGLRLWQALDGGTAPAEATCDSMHEPASRGLGTELPAVAAVQSSWWQGADRAETLR